MCGLMPGTGHTAHPSQDVGPEMGNQEVRAGAPQPLSLWPGGLFKVGPPALPWPPAVGISSLDREREGARTVFPPSFYLKHSSSFYTGTVHTHGVDYLTRR